jgi:hypothetical protein
MLQKKARLKEAEAARAVDTREPLLTNLALPEHLLSVLSRAAATEASSREPPHRGRADHLLGSLDMRKLLLRQV